jgi:hypothetical protein
MQVCARRPQETQPWGGGGAAPRLPDYKDRKKWAAGFKPLEKKECDAILRRAKARLKERYA